MVVSETAERATWTMRVIEHQAKMCALAGQTAEADVLRDAMLILRGLTLDTIGKLRGVTVRFRDTDEPQQSAGFMNKDNVPQH